MKGHPVANPDQNLLTRAWRVLAVQTAAAITVSLLVLGLLVFVVVTRSQNNATAAVLQQTAASEEDVVDPPPHVWIFVQEGAGTTTATKDAPTELPDRGALQRVRTGGATETTRINTPGGSYLTLTRQRGIKTVQVVISLQEQHDERERLLGALVAGEIAGLVIALISAALLARRATAPLADALARQRQFVADASHELRTPLTQLHTRAQLLQHDLRTGAAGTVAADVDELVTGTRHLGEVVEDLLLSTQLGRRDDAGVPVDLQQVAAGVIASQSARAVAHGIGLALNRSTEQTPTVHGHEPALRRVLTALIDNALNHTPAQGHVTVDMGLEHSLVTVTVRDNGAGFDPADAERLFARFARGGHNDQRRFGLGLALASEVITGHGGTISASTNPDGGAAFTVRLPRSNH